MQQNSWKEQRSSATTASHSMSSIARRKARQAMRAVYARRAKVEQNVRQRKERKWSAPAAVARNYFCVSMVAGTDHRTSWYKA